MTRPDLPVVAWPTAEDHSAVAASPFGGLEVVRGNADVESNKMRKDKSAFRIRSEQLVSSIATLI
jgi:hypothetical protein